MSTSVSRRIFLKGSLAAGAVGAAVGAGLLTPQAVLAAWPSTAFEAKSEKDALNALLGSEATSANDDIKIKAPDIAENGAVVPITVSAGIAGVESIAILATKNPTPLVASCELGDGAQPFISTRIKMGETGDVVAVCKAGGKLFSQRKSVKVTIGGCGG